MSPVNFGIIGGGWRSLFFLRIAAELPERFRVGGMLVRDPDKGRALEQKWGVRTFRSVNELLAAGDFQFVVVSVPWGVCPVMLHALAERDVPVLAETPPAPDLAGLIDICELARQGAKIQVSEQYQFHPLHAARIRIARSGLLGTVTQAQVSICHGYHGVNLIRQLLDVGFAEATVRGHAFVSPLVQSPDRDGPPGEERIVDSKQVIATLDFGDRLGLYDFSGDQYFSYVRSHRMLVRGEKGEINNLDVRYLQDYLTPIEYTLRRVDTGHGGNLEGYCHKGVLAGSEWIYRNAYMPARLTDDEIAIATCLDAMAAYADGGPGFCSAAEAAQDHYLGMAIEEAARTGETVVAVRQPWAD